MKKRISVIAALLSLALLLSSCGAKPLPDGMEEETVGEAGRSIVNLLAAEEYQTVVDAFHPEFREEYDVTADKVAEIMDTVSAAGPFVQIEKTLAVGGKSDNYAGSYASVVVYAVHEESDVIYELSITPDLALIGLSVQEK